MELVIVILILLNVLLIIACFLLCGKIKGYKNQYQEMTECNKKLHRLIAIKYMEFSLRFNPELKERI